ncbi:MAG TPA: hypothetical protein VFM18_05425 [Methanosarcina sp.]|nr:hypothetical protein [Methanosarcina sp.]
MSNFDKVSRLNIVFDRIRNLAQENEEFCDSFISMLEEELDCYLANDWFGTEGQNDPRGDMRDKLYTMNRVQGFDD